jgi:hypothetical protein
MGNQRFRCRHCKKLCCQRTEKQQYCGREACQKARKNTWRRRKAEVDPDYRANQRASTQAWLASQGGCSAYYRLYRERRRRRARCGQSDDAAAERARPPAGASRAKSDATRAQSLVIAGRYQLVPLGGAKSDAIWVQLTVIAGT